MKHDLRRLLNWPEEFWDWRLSLVISPIVHPQRWHPDNFELVKLPLSLTVHPLLAPILTARVPKTCRETTMFCLRYLQSGGHSVKTRNSLKPLLKSGYFTSLLRFRTRPRRHPSRRCLLVYQDLRSMWWGDHPERPISYIRRLDKFGVEQLLQLPVGVRV